MAKTPPKSPTPEEIVAKWQKRVESRLKPWHLAPGVATSEGRKLRRQIKSLLATGAVFGKKEMKNSLKVAGDIAKICKILQPAPHSKEIRLDTFQRVRSMCAKSHKTCQAATTPGAGGWCDV